MEDGSHFENVYHCTLNLFGCCLIKSIFLNISLHYCFNVTAQNFHVYIGTIVLMINAIK
jgi:hypothetical protein